MQSAEHNTELRIQERARDHPGAAEVTQNRLQPDDFVSCRNIHNRRVMSASQQTVIFSLKSDIRGFKIRAGETLLLPQQSVGIRFTARDNSDKIPRDKCDS